MARQPQRDWATLDTIRDARPVIERLLRRMSAPGAPWTVVESTDERYRDVTVARTILRGAVGAPRSRTPRRAPTCRPSCSRPPRTR